jgi:hypothetical protein
MPNTNLKAIIVTIAENKSHYYEYNKGQILHNSDLDNQGIDDYQDAKVSQTTQHHQAK